MSIPCKAVGASAVVVKTVSGPPSRSGETVKRTGQEAAAPASSLIGIGPRSRLGSVWERVAINPGLFRRRRKGAVQLTLDGALYPPLERSGQKAQLYSDTNVL